MPMKSVRTSVVALAILCGHMSKPATAALGGNRDSVLRDEMGLYATQTLTPTASYDLYERRTADGLYVREYLSRAGVVFCVSWYGVGSPNVGALLGGYAGRYHAVAHVHRGNHHILAVEDPDFVFTLLRLPRGWRGQAYLPTAIPEGVSRAELR
jgi:hypothetical protein